MVSNSLPTQPAYIEGFVYGVVIKGTSELFQREPLLSSIPNIAEMTISSEWFKDFNECQEDLANFLTSTAVLLSGTTGKGYVLTKKMNPMYSENYKPDVDVGWEPTMVMKIYVTNAQSLSDKNKVDSDIVAVLRAAPRYLSIQATLITQ